MAGGGYRTGMVWTFSHCIALAILLSAGVSGADVGRWWGCSTSSVAGAKRRHLRKVVEPSALAARARRAQPYVRVQDVHADSEFIEKYADRKIRLAAERRQCLDRAAAAAAHAH